MVQIPIKIDPRTGSIKGAQGWAAPYPVLPRRLANLDNGQLTQIGRPMVIAQKQRIRRGINANNQPAKELSKAYKLRKTRVLRRIGKLTGTFAVRDMVFTGATLENFSLRKAINGVIRAEPSTQWARTRAQKAVSGGADAQLIGFSGDDATVVITEAERQYGHNIRKAVLKLAGS